MKKYFIYLGVCVLFSCKKDNPQNDPVTYGNSFVLSIIADKSAYHPGDIVNFKVNKPAEGDITIRYRHLNETISESKWNGGSWTWTVPVTDFKGYMVDLYTKAANGTDSILASAGIDVSSDWSKFPRYGFLSGYGNYSEASMKSVLDKLTRYHINGIQYYDWLYKHHWPLGGTASNPMPVWTEIANKEVYLNTLKYYIDEGHKRNINSMFYNLAFGALEDAMSDGVNREWYLFKDNQHTEIDQHTLPKPYFRSNILLTNAGNENWQQYIIGKNTDVYATLNFDGYHVDALGERGTLYDYNGNVVNQQATYQSFLEAMKAAHPQKKLVMNAVNQNGQLNHILKSPVEFPYTEVWGPNETYESLRKIIADNFETSNGKSTILAAYMNYDKSSSKGYFNTHAVLLADAVIFAFGGAHLELGEHMLSNEYFPNNNLMMQDDLAIAITKYYDFLVAYENLLRDGGTFDNTSIECTDDQFVIQNWPASGGKVAAISKKVDHRQVFHLINFSKNSSLNWRDANGTALAPALFKDVALSFQSAAPVKKLWLASPDADHGVAKEISFIQTGNTVQFNLPSLLYWNMIVAEY